jgi:hypothetical protein
MELCSSSSILNILDCCNLLIYLRFISFLFYFNYLDYNRQARSILLFGVLLEVGTFDFIPYVLSMFFHIADVGAPMASTSPYLYYCITKNLELVLLYNCLYYV